MTRIEKDYEKMVFSGMFWEFFPELTGQWEQDKEAWMEMVERREVNNNYTEEEIKAQYPLTLKECFKK